MKTLLVKKDAKHSMDARGIDFGGIRLREAEVEKLHGYSFLEISSVRRI